VTESLAFSLGILVQWYFSLKKNLINNGFVGRPILQLGCIVITAIKFANFQRSRHQSLVDDPLEIFVFG